MIRKLAGAYWLLLRVEARILAVGILAVGVFAFAGDNVRVIDGDTLEISGVTVRIIGIDTPETHHARCAQEMALGLQAKRKLESLVASGHVTYRSSGVDRYGRVLAHVYVDGIDVGQAMLDAGFAVIWHPGPEAKAWRLTNWCGGNDA